MIKTTIGTLDNSVGTLNKIVTQELPALTSFKFATIVKEVSSKLEVFQKEKQKLFQKYGEAVTDQPDQMKITDENLEVFSEELNSLITQEVELSVTPLDVDDFKDIKLNIMDATGLLWLIKKD